ncbi:hypothetical protein ACDX66_08185 [Peribacillus frigoritolerans]
MKRRNFLKNMLIFTVAFIFGYSVKNEVEEIEEIGDIMNDLKYNFINLRLPPYNAPANGIGDCSHAINAAISDLPNGGIIYCPRGTGAYRFLNKISPNANTTILGDGKTVFEMDSWIEINQKEKVAIKRINFINCKKKILFALRNNNMIVENCYFENIGFEYPAIISAYESHCIHLYNAKGVVLEGNTFKNIKSDNVIRIENTFVTDGNYSDFEITNNTFDTTTYKCIAFAYSESNKNNTNNIGKIKRNKFYNIGINHPTNGIGTVAVYAWYNRPNYSVDVVDNIFDKVVENAIEGTYGSISNNIIINAGYKPNNNFTTSSGAGISPYGTPIIKNNRIYSCRTAGIKWYLNNSYTNSINEVICKDNLIDTVGSGTGRSIDFNIQGRLAKNILIKDNITKNSSGGIYINATNTDNKNIMCIDNIGLLTVTTESNGVKS